MKEFKLDEMPKIKSGFKTPEDYFDAFSEKMVAQLPEEKPKTIPLFGSRKKLLFAVAAVLVVALSVPIFNTLSSNNAVIDQQTLEDYIAQNTRISENDILELLEKEDIEKLNLDYQIPDKNVEDVLSTNENLEQYITN
jgi:hypothetical protein